MNTGTFDYKITLEVTMTNDELGLLFKLASTHYDWRCKAAIQEGNSHGARENGYLQIMRMVVAPHRWGFHEFDTTAKILESAAYLTNQRELELATSLAYRIHEAIGAIREEYARLMAEQKSSG